MVGVATNAVNSPWNPDAIARIVLAPEDCTVTTPVEVLRILYLAPVGTLVVGNKTVWFRLPVHTCISVDVIVIVVLEPAVAVVVKPSKKLFAEKFLLPSHWEMLRPLGLEV